MQLVMAVVAAAVYALVALSVAPPLDPAHCVALAPLAPVHAAVCGGGGGAQVAVTVGAAAGAAQRAAAGAVAAAVRAAVAGNGEAAARVAVYADGELVVDVRAVSGGAAAATGDDAPDDDLFVVFSCTKVLESLAVAILADRGFLDYDAPITDVWPGFAPGNGSATLAHLMRHELGLPALDRTLSLGWLSASSDSERTALAETLAVQMPMSAPGERTFYHAITRGLFVDEIVRRADPHGRSLAHFVQEEIAAPLGLVGELAIGDGPGGLTPTLDARVVTHIPPHILTLAGTYLPQLFLPRGLARALYSDDTVLDGFEADFMASIVLSPSSTAARSITIADSAGERLKSAADMANSPEFRARGLTSAAGVTHARALAKIGSVLAGGGAPLLSPAGLAAANAVRDDAPRFDEGFWRNISYSAAGWGMDRFALYGLPDWEGWAGAGGAVFIWNRKINTAFAYTPSLLLPRLKKVRGTRYLRAYLDALDAAAA
ncbi:esterase [Thecamonas trahens ATCC 50062]|uniref:Esterase n=1 Tax=Thecamonas trahens ATCC 50062 TaxID=461836 RepID=A0A0L0DFT6_THETB|nr:esterase [Thecamonas trahens ATCC 50062]KNC51192.1 esterase [Thecamonas trahens ATCC 50062]|eukprot:XP_013756392.1 esterase [Thecamonas trahens ATCC 50062]